MTKSELIKSLVRIANTLDTKECIGEANELTKIAQSVIGTGGVAGGAIGTIPSTLDNCRKCAGCFGGNMKLCPDIMAVLKDIFEKEGCLGGLPDRECLERLYARFYTCIKSGICKWKGRDICKVVDQITYNEHMATNACVLWFEVHNAL